MTDLLRPRAPKTIEVTSTPVTQPAKPVVGDDGLEPAITVASGNGDSKATRTDPAERPSAKAKPPEVPDAF
jgi:hypothetical protein